MYQVVINDKFYVSDVDVDARCIDGFCLVFGFETTTDKYNAKFFEYKEEAQSIAKQIGGRVIEYVEMKDIQIDMSISEHDLKELLQLGAIKLKG